MPMTAIGMAEVLPAPSESLVCPEAFKCPCVVRVIVCKMSILKYPLLSCLIDLLGGNDLVTFGVWTVGMTIYPM